VHKMNKFPLFDNKKNLLHGQGVDVGLEDSSIAKIKTLEILMPVYNQEFFCSRIIRNIESYITNEIGVLIQDDCSKDSTYEILSRHFYNHENVKVFRTKNNIGPNGNFMSLTELANSEYLLPLGGDDFINQGAIQQVLQILKGDPFDIGIFNCAHAQLETIDQVIFEAPKSTNKLNIAIKNYNYTESNNLNLDSFFHQIATLPGALWLQGVVMRTNLFKKIPKMESSNVDDWGICHNLAAYNIDHKLNVKTYSIIISLLTLVSNSRGSQFSEQLTRQLSAVVNDWHPKFQKDAFYNVVLKKLKQLHEADLEVEEKISILNNSFSKILK
jgi:glycosyltransferase involved in cell wall biosynthesis